jgi:hypothetical protein
MKFIYIFLFLIVFLFSVSLKAIAQSIPAATGDARFINVSYDLPYPGILPDNPLYLLKVIRDNVINIFIINPVKKANYDLLMADKRLAGSQALVGKKNYQLAITTLSKSGNYFDQAIQLAQQARTRGMDVVTILNKLYTASEKHQLVIYQMSKVVDKKVKVDFELLQVRAKTFQDTVDVIRSQ